MLGTRLGLVSISHDKRVASNSQSVQCSINPFSFLDILTIPSVVLFAKESLNLTGTSPCYRLLKGRLLRKRVRETPSRRVRPSRLQ